eukprot:354809-Pelagomonas_calceolata.AAC.7
MGLPERKEAPSSTSAQDSSSSMQHQLLWLYKLGALLYRFCWGPGNCSSLHETPALACSTCSFGPPAGLATKEQVLARHASLWHS